MAGCQMVFLSRVSNWNNTIGMGIGMGITSFLSQLYNYGKSPQLRSRSRFVVNTRRFCSLATEHSGCSARAPARARCWGLTPGLEVVVAPAQDTAPKGPARGRVQHRSALARSDALEKTEHYNKDTGQLAGLDLRGSCLSPSSLPPFTLMPRPPPSFQSHFGVPRGGSYPL